MSLLRNNCREVLDRMRAGERLIGPVRVTRCKSARGAIIRRWGFEGRNSVSATTVIALERRGLTRVRMTEPREAVLDTVKS
jgi:hypothetical protein